MERHHFHQRRQKSGEAFEAYTAATHQLSSGCDFSKVTDKSAHNQLLEGAASQHIRERLLFEGTSLTPNRAVDIGRQIKQTQQGLKELSGDPIVQRVVEKFASRSDGVASN